MQVMKKEGRFSTANAVLFRIFKLYVREHIIKLKRDMPKLPLESIANEVVQSLYKLIAL